MKQFGKWEWVAFILVLVGGVDWGVIGLSKSINIIGLILGGDTSLLARLLYILIGLSAVYLVYVFFFKKEA